MQKHGCVLYIGPVNRGPNKIYGLHSNANKIALLLYQPILVFGIQLFIRWTTQQSVGIGHYFLGYIYIYNQY